MNAIHRMRRVAAAWLGARSPSIPLVPANTFLAPGNQWYQPMLAGAQTLAQLTTGGAVVRHALTVLERLTPDAYSEFVTGFYRAGLEKFGDGWQYADINTALLGLASALQPATYLEIGVRRGRSLAMVASCAPSCRIVACDLFIKNYGNMDNPGPDFVRSELARVGFAGSVEFIVGDSAIVVPDYFGRNPGQYFDLITVDGDHSERGARMDLVNVISRLKVGGAVVFDDVSNHSHPELVGVWRDVVGCSPNFSSCCFTDVGFGVAFAVRKS